MSADPVRLTGTAQPPAPARELRAGSLQATLVEGGLRSIRFNGIEVLRAIAYVVRDGEWGTYAPAFTDQHVEQEADRFVVSYQAACIDRDAGQSLRYTARIEADAGGRLHFEVSATPDTAFLTARCGFAVLHPLRGVVGAPARIAHVDGRLRDARFPDLIEPWQPFGDIRAITHWPVAGLEATCLLEGDTFEMEDQRAWSDASFKTYVRPIELPWPYSLPAGIENRQSVILKIEDRRGASAVGAASDDVPVRLGLGAPVGAMPAIGVVIYPDQVAAILHQPETLRALAPSRVLFHLDPVAGHGRAALSGFAAVAGLMPGAEIGLEVAVPAQAPLDEEMRALRADLEAAGLAPHALMVSPAVDRHSTPPGSAWPPCPPLAELYRAARDAFPAVRLGGGMLSYFTELNRKRPPVEMLDFVSHCTCPIVHAADDLSVMQSLEALPEIFRSARAIIGDERPYRIGPSTIGMRQNPYGARLMSNPDGVRMPMSDRDPRQRGLFAAAWAVGYAAATEQAALDGWVPCSVFGSMGVAEPTARGARRYPVFHVVRAMAALGGLPRLACLTDAPERIAAVACRDAGGGIVLWIANLTPETREVVLDRSGWSVVPTGEDLGAAQLHDERLRLDAYAVTGLRCSATGSDDVRSPANGGVAG